MKTFLYAVLAGAATEALFAWMLFGTGWGPCGPGSLLGYFGMLAHVFPGMVLGIVFDWLFTLPPIYSDNSLIAIQLVGWVLFYWLLLKKAIKMRVVRSAL